MKKQNPKIIIIDDEEAILRSMERLFRKDDYDIHVTSDCAQALVRAKEEEIALVISDQRMPEMSGSEVLAAVRDISPDTIRILLTGYSDLAAVIEAVNQGGIYQYIAKPWDDEHLRLTVKRALEQYNLKKENDQLTQVLKEQNDELEKLLYKLDGERETLEDRHRLKDQLLMIILNNPYVKNNVKIGGKPISAILEKLNTRDQPSNSQTIPEQKQPTPPEKKSVPSGNGIKRILSATDIENRFQRIKEIKALPFIAAEVLKITGDHETSARDLVEVITRDQSITSRILQMSNSAFYRSKGRITTLEQAVVKIGFVGIRQLALGIAIVEQFKNGEDGLDRIGLWKHSLATGVIARIIAKEIGYQDQEQAFLGGLLHDIGKIFYDEYFHEQYSQTLIAGAKHRMAWNDIEEQMLGLDHTKLAKKVLEMWSLPDSIRDVIVFHHHPHEKIINLRSKDNILISIVSLADTLAKLMGYYVGELDLIEDIDNRLLTFLSLPVDEGIQPILNDVRKEVNDLEMILLLHNTEGIKFTKYNESERLEADKKTVFILSDKQRTIDPLEVMLSKHYFVYKGRYEEIASHANSLDLIIIHVDSEETANILPEQLTKLRLEQNMNIPMIVLSQEDHRSALETYVNSSHPIYYSPFFMKDIEDSLSSFALPTSH